MAKKPSIIREQCGTNAGYNKHVRMLEETCVECRKAHSVQTRKNRKELRERRGIPEVICGTDRGYYRHIRLGEERCISCKNAHTEAERKRIRHRTGKEIKPRQFKRRPSLSLKTRMVSMDHVMFAAVYFSLTPDVQQILDEFFDPDRVSKLVGDLTGEELAWRHKFIMENRERQREQRERRRVAGAT
ncbi:hypothetical protein SEA_GODONK_197 [Gordonia phage GodonK]|uniref:Uncharacterized protein n=1 Tax=Gordonia phage GodonK TaxID=2562192 RepID=A0A4D6E4A2_9CAUD|nr:hypothetical protein HOV33_gp171 [Gordonia phage GodonK]QBZ72785.1 hypothetical protein SEA_GODONK_197 [Gordonia phage GodonK]